MALGRFVPGVRILAAVSAGTARMSWASFLRFNVLGAVVWAIAMGCLGFAAGRGSQRLGVAVGGSALVLLAIAFAAMGFAWAFRRLRGAGSGAYF